MITKEKLTQDITTYLFDWVDVTHANEKRYMNITKVIEYYFTNTIFLYAECPTTANLFVDEIEDLYVELEQFLLLKPSEALQLMEREVNESFDWYSNVVHHDSLERINVEYLYKIYKNSGEYNNNALTCIETYVKENIIHFIHQIPEDYIKQVQDAVKLNVFKVNELWKKIYSR